MGEQERPPRPELEPVECRALAEKCMRHGNAKEAGVYASLAVAAELAEIRLELRRRR